MKKFETEFKDKYGQMCQGPTVTFATKAGASKYLKANEVSATDSKGIAVSVIVGLKGERKTVKEKA